MLAAGSYYPEHVILKIIGNQFVMIEKVICLLMCNHEAITQTMP